MSEPDVVALIRNALADDPCPERIILSRHRLQELCDEIVALRETLAGVGEHEPADTRHVRIFRNRLHQVRAEALEEAAALCQSRFKTPMDVEALNCARAIRVLKDNG